MQETKKAPKEKSIFTPERTVRFFIISVIGYIIAAMIIWPLMELLLSNMTGSSYTWTILNGIVEPCIFGLIITILEFLFWNLLHKK